MDDNEYMIIERCLSIAFKRHDQFHTRRQVCSDHLSELSFNGYYFLRVVLFHSQDECRIITSPFRYFPYSYLLNNVITLHQINMFWLQADLGISLSHEACRHHQRRLTTLTNELETKLVSSHVLILLGSLHDCILKL
jgi:hypothetical protein